MFIAELFKIIANIVKSLMVKLNLLTKEKADKWSSEIVAIFLILLTILLVSILT